MTMRARRMRPAWSVEHKKRRHAEAALAERPVDRVSQAAIDESLEETFPASDPQSFVAIRIGAPRREAA
ncbi:MAG: hypothetical protein C5B56_01010 [Proteobacteria bacterium]|nr:MAG: hypothetical protein C5B56_01010 [Pseudomonadota bacterium]